MPSDTFLKTAKESNRQPVVLMAVESLNNVRVASASRDGWGEAKASHHVDIDSEPGFVVPGAIPLTGTVGTQVPVPYHLKVKEVAGTLRLTNNSGTSVSGTYFLEVAVKDGSGNQVSTAGVWLNYTVAASSFITQNVLFHLKDEPFFASGGTVDVSAVSSSEGQTVVSWETDPQLTVRPSDGWVQTKTLDLGAVPTEGPVLGVDAVVPAVTSITCSARGSNDGMSWTDLGAVAPGDTLLPYRYYDVQADLNFAAWDVPKLKEIYLEGGDKAYEYFSTHRDEPIAGAKPYLQEKAVSTLNSKIELLKPPSTGEVSVKMVWTRETGELLKSGYLKNKKVIVKIGFRGMAEADYETVFVGTWYDYSADPSRMEINVKVRDVLKQFAKRKLPIESVDAGGNKVTTPLAWTDANIMQVMLDIFTELGIPDQYIDRAAFETLRDGALSGPDWQVTRTLSEPEEAAKLLNELAVMAGVFLLPQQEGLLTPILYDSAAAAVTTLDARAMKFGRLEGGQKELFTRQQIYHAPNKEKPGDNEEDYDRALIYINSDAEINWGESTQKNWYDKWNASDQAVTELAKRMDDWFANPRLTVKVDDVPPRFIDILPGQILTVDNLRLPDLATNWPGLSAGNKFLVLSRNFEPNKGALSLSLYDVGAVGTPGAGVVGTDLVISGSDKPYGPTNVYTFVGGTPPYAWSSTTGVLTGIDSTSFNLDVTGVIGGGAISVTDAGGTVIHKFNVLPPQVANLAATILPEGAKLSWDAADPAAIAEYEIRKGNTWANGVFVARIRATEYHLGFLSAGDHTYFVAAIDIYGNYSGDPTQTALTVSVPAAPVATGEFVGGNFRLSWQEVMGGFETVGYEIRYGGDWASGTFLNTIKSRDYKGQAKWSGMRTFWIAALDAAGLTGPPAAVPLTVDLASAPVVIPQVMDNNVLLKWSAVQGTLPVAEYEVRRGSDFNSAEVVGRKTGTFTAIFEDLPGTFTYWVAAIDSAGNYGAAASAIATVIEPPDYVLKADWDSDFSGSRTNAKTYDGKLLAPISVSETWAQHFTNHAWNTPQDQIDAGYPVYIQPSEISGQYQETFDYGTVLPGTRITITPTVTAVAGSVTVTPTIEVSTDNATWTTYVGQNKVFATNLRYVRVTLDFAPGDDKSVICLDRLKVTLDVKLKSDAGNGTAAAADPTGTVVTFNKQFIDVTSINVSPKGSSAVIPVYDFDGLPYSTSFQVYLFDTNGNRVSGDFTWTARGY